MSVFNFKSMHFFGGVLLIAGCCIGAGMLGLPVLSAQAGFYPTLLVFLICWLFMASTGLLLLEVNLEYPGEISLITMAKKTLGPIGQIVSWIVYLGLFYSLMVAYVAASGLLIKDFINQLAGISAYAGLSELIFCLFFGIFLYFGTSAMDWVNRFLMIGLILTYVMLISIGVPHVQTTLLEHREWSKATSVIPIAIVSFGFHNLIPSLTNYYERNKKALIWMVIIGSVVPLFIYLIWEWLILGIVPVENFNLALDQGEMATEALREVAKASWIVDVAQSFAFFAIVTSFLGVALSFVDFLADGFKIKKTNKGKILLISLVLIPSFFCSFLYPTIFLTALNIAGGYGAVILFGILPALMVWKKRYLQKASQNTLVPGGRSFLFAIIGFSIWVIFLQIF